uniref:Uncharacterized protein n=1 Tax=Globisporangium ultimum (strain ATCC 200006 / CBS 805.95 / DAOM BR144) TaxID=431595 RepID=K3X6A1_GLOUD
MTVSFTLNRPDLMGPTMHQDLPSPLQYFSSVWFAKPSGKYDQVRSLLNTAGQSRATRAIYKRAHARSAG